MRHHVVFLVSLMLTFLATQPSLAQDENAAFYIYQNDGHVDGFFYDQVKKISYSKIDTLGMEHENYVSQEIITADSTYRIMLSAIDSVSFVQPEIKMNPKMRDMRKEGMLTYLTSKDDDALMLTFSSSMPESLRPQVGDVLIDFDFEEGFGGKVKSVSNGGAITVACDPIEGLGDVFQQFITVEQIDKNKEGELVRSRTAGLPEATVDNRARLMAPYRASDGTFEGNIFNFGISGHWTVLDSADVSVTVDANINSALTIKGSYKISTFGGYYMSLTFQNDLDFGLGLTVDAKLGEMKERQTPFKASVPLPAAAPIFELRSIPGLFLKGDAHMKFSADLVKYRKRVWHKLEFNNDWLPSFNFGDAQLPELDDAIDKPWERDASIEFNGTIMAGIHGPLELGINSWLKKWLDASFGIHLYIGPKISGAINFSLSNVYKDKISVYNLLKDTKLSLQPCAFDFEAKAQLNTLFSGKKEVTVADGSVSLMGDIEVYVFPDFSLNVSASEMDRYWGKVNATLQPSRNLFFPVQVGVGLFDRGTYDLVDFRMADDAKEPLLDYWQFSKEWKERKSVDLEWYTHPGEYDARPIFRLYGWDIVASPAVEVTVPGPYLKIKPDTLLFDCQGNYKGGPVKVSTNLYPKIKGADDWTITGSDKTWTIENPTWTGRADRRVNYSLVKHKLESVVIDGYDSKAEAENGGTPVLREVPIRLFEEPNRTFLPNRVELATMTDDDIWINTMLPPEIVPQCTFVNDTLLHVSCNNTVYETYYDEEVPDFHFSCEFDITLHMKDLSNWAASYLEVKEITYNYERTDYSKKGDEIITTVHSHGGTFTPQYVYEYVYSDHYAIEVVMPPFKDYAQIIRLRYDKPQ